MPAGANINGIEVKTDAWSTADPDNGLASLNPIGIGAYDQWSLGGGSGTKVSAVSSNGGAYIDETTGTEAQTFTVENAAIPANSTINSVTLVVNAKQSSGSGADAKIKLRIENGAAFDDGSEVTLSDSDRDYSRIMATNPFTGSAWTLDEVNSWTTRFGVVRTSATGGRTPRVDQISVRVDYTTVSASCRLGVDLSWNGGSTWTNEKTQNLTDTETTYTIGGASDTWTGHSWVSDDFSDANFRLRVHDVDPGSACFNNATTKIDWIQVKVHYTPGTAQVRAFKYFDVNRSGNYDEGDYPLSGWRISLYSGNGGTYISDKTTGTDGYTEYWNDVPVVGADELWLQENPPEEGGWLAINPSDEGGFGTYRGLDITGGESKTFSFGNYRAPRLTVTKVVVNDDGGTKEVSDFPLFVGEASVTSGAEGVYAAGTYTVSETSQSGYAGTISGDCAADGSITLLPGDVKSCTVTNDDVAPLCQIDGYKYDAENHPVSGVVIGAKTEPIGEGEEHTNGSVIVTKTDENGRYCLNGVPTTGSSVRVFEWPASGTENDHITVDEHGVDPRINSFFDIFPEVAIRMDEPRQPASVDSFFDVFTEINGGTKQRIESFFDIFTELHVGEQQRPADSFFDIFTEINLGKEQDNHHTISFYNKAIEARESTSETANPPGAVGLGFLGTNPGAAGLVLGASTSTSETIGDSCIAEGPYLRDYLRIGRNNDPEQVVRLQRFLNENLPANIPVTGYFGPITLDAVKRFQLVNADQILAPWFPYGLDNKTPTGYVYKLTLRWINLLHCTGLDIPMPQIP